MFSLSAKSQNVDSLWSVWNDTFQEDTVRLQALNGLIDSYRRNDLDTAFELADKMVRLASENELWFWQAEGTRLKGDILAAKSDFDKALEYLNESLNICHEYDFKSLLANTYQRIGTIHFYQGNYLEALRILQISLAIKENIGEDDLSNSYEIFGAVYFQQSDYSRALEYFLKAAAISEKSSFEADLSTPYNNIGAVYFYQKNYKKALEYYQKSLTLDEETEDKLGVSITLYNMGEANLFMSDYQKAFEYINRSIEISQSLEDKWGLAGSYSMLGQIYARQNNYSKAQEYYETSLTIAQELGLRSELGATSIAIGKLNIDTGDYKKAIYWCNEGLKLAEESNSLVQKRNACECLYRSNKALGKGIEALEYHERFLMLQDSLNLRDTHEQLQQMEFSKQVEADSIIREKEKLEASLAFQTEVDKQKTRKNIFILVAIGIFLLAGILWISRASIKKEKTRSENLLLNILPSEVAEELKEKGESDAKDFDDVSVIFSDFKGFTRISEHLNAQELVAEINTCFKAFDKIITSYGIEKIKTIGDSYMAAGGLHTPRTSTTKDVVMAGLDIQAFIEERKSDLESQNKPFFEMRVGIHTGPVVAGIVGVKKFQYDIWGDTVNVASRMESSGQIGTVNISETTYNLVKDENDLMFEPRGQIEAKNKGKIEMYFVKKAS